jgi:hypothetical protein
MKIRDDMLDIYIVYRFNIDITFPKRQCEIVFALEMYLSDLIALRGESA